jgi:hypothetical protein
MGLDRARPATGIGGGVTPLVADLQLKEAQGEPLR